MLIDRNHWPILSKLLDQALEVPPEARERWLESLSPDDSLYKEDLRTLLRHSTTAETREFLDILPNLKEAVEDARAAVSTPARKPGTAVGPYVIEREIGSGGMGAVWLGRRSDGLIKRPVALKLPHPGRHSRYLAERFASERDILAELTHPNIARLYDAGFSDDGQPFLALEYVAGAPLIEYCDHQRLDLRQRLRLFQQVLQAVQYAHGNLVIHGDLKPSNVIVGPGQRALLLDFGIARLIGSLQDGEAWSQAIDAREANGRLRGGPCGAALTPDYASPEQIGGQSVTTTSDIYSLGVLLFELLTGERPYGRTTRAELEKAVLTVEPRRPSQSIRCPRAASARGCTIRDLARELSGDLDSIVLKALAKSPSERYATADAFCEDIERFLEGKPTAAGRGSGWYIARKFIVRHKASAAGTSVAFVAIIATAAVALCEAHAAAGHARAAAAERDRALALSSRNEAVADFLNVLITEAAGTDRPMTIGDMLSRSEALVSAEFHGSREHRTAVLDMVGSYYRTIGDEKRALHLLQDASDTIRGSPDADLQRKVRCDLALTLANLGRVVDAKSMLDEVITDPQSTAQQAAECLSYRSTAAGIESDPAGAVEYGHLALQRLRGATNPSAAVEAGILAAIGDGERLAGHSAMAEEYFQRSLHQYAQTGRSRGPDATVIRNNLAVVYDATGNPRRALELYDEILQTAAKTDPTALQPVVTIGNRARALDLIGRFEESRSTYLHCIELGIRGRLPNMRLHCLTGLAWVSRELQDMKSADRYLREALELAGDVSFTSRSERLALEITRGRIALANNELAQARSSLDRAVADGNTVFFRMAALLPRAQLNLEEGRLAEAESDAREALALARSAQGDVPHSSRTGSSWLILGKVLAGRGDVAGSQRAFRAALEHLSETVDTGHPELLLARQLAHVGE